MEGSLLSPPLQRGVRGDFPYHTHGIRPAPDRTAKLWEVATGRCVRTYSGHSDSVQSCVLSADGGRLVTGSNDGTVKLWATASGRCDLTLVQGPHGQTAALDLAANRLVVASPEAWRFLGWRYHDAEAKRLRILPVEHFGPLPSGDATHILKLGPSLPAGLG